MAFEVHDLGQLSLDVDLPEVDDMSRDRFEVSEKQLRLLKTNLSERAAGAKMDFSHLDRVDTIEALRRFEIRRNMTKTGIFTPVQPFGER